MHAFRAIYARRVVPTDGFSCSRDDAALQGNLHQMLLQQNCLLTSLGEHDTQLLAVAACEQRREQPDGSALEKGDAARASQL